MYSKQKICTPILWFKTSPGYVDVSVSLLLICCFIQKWSIWFGQQQSFWKGYCICHRQYSSDAFLESRQKVSMRKVPPLTVSSKHYNNIQFILNVQSDWSLFITETGLIVGKLIEGEVGMGSNLEICSELYFGVLEKTRMYSQGEGHCPITTNRLPRGETNQIIHSARSRGGAWVVQAPPLFLDQTEKIILETAPPPPNPYLRFSMTNACSTKDNITFPSLANHIVLFKFWKLS